MNNNIMPMISYALPKYIKINYGSNAKFARAIDVSPQQVTNWIASGFIVVDDKLYSHRRDFPKIS